MEESAFGGLKSKKVHPRFRSNIISKHLMIWGFPLLIKGWRKEISEDDLYKPPTHHESAKIGDDLEEAWNKEKSKVNPSFLKVLLRVYWIDLAVTGLTNVIVEIIVRLSQPLILGKLLSYWVPNQKEITTEDAYFWACLMILTNFLSLLLVNMNQLRLFELAMKVRIGCTSLIYRKALKLDKSSMEQNTVGQMVNLMANDTRRFDMLMHVIHTLWLTPVLVLVIIYLMSINLGDTSLTGMIILAVFVPMQFYLGKKTSTFRLRTAVRTDQRVKVMNEIISGIQIIKMYTWEKPFAYLVQQTRKSEIMQIRAISFVRGINFSFGTFLTRASILISVVTYVLTGNHLNAQFAFVATNYYNMLRGLLAVQLPMAISSVAETRVSIHRLQKFFLSNELTPRESYESIDYIKNGKATNGSALQLEPMKKFVGVSLQNASAKWKRATENTLKNINFEAAAGQLVAIVGGVGSGKTSLLHVILGELPIITGSIEVGGRISYASQEPWLFSGSVKQNILFGQQMDMKRYQDVIRVCALSHDFQNFSHGDQTLVGEKGVALSGGQKARINLARAVYRDADIYLLDDPLSAVDTQVGKQLFDTCIAGYLKNKCVILVTHQIQYLKAADRINLLENGEINVSGTYEEIQKSDHDFLKLFKTEIEEEEEIVRRKSMKKEREGKKEEGDKPKEVKEHMETGKIDFTHYIRYFKSGGNCCVLFLIFCGYILATLASSGSDYFLTFWVNLEQDKLNATTVVKNSNDSGISTELPLDFSTPSQIPIINDTGLDTDFLDQKFFDWFFTTDTCIYLYTSLVVSTIVITLTRSLSFYAFCMEASKRIHKNMFIRLLYAPMYFFNSNNSGRILNRFSRDLGSVDEVLPNCFADTLQTGLGVIANIILITTVSSWIILPTVILLVLFYFYRNVYIASSRNLKRMDGTTKSPVFGHFNATVSGLTTIRACGAQQILKNEFDHHQDLNTAAYYMFITTNRTFSFWLDINNLLYTSFVILSFLFLGTETYGGNVGLAITQSMTLTIFLQWGIRQSSELENQMTSVERVLEYTDIQAEPDHGRQIPPKSWPDKGQIEFRSVSMKYSENAPYVLRNLSFLIEPKEKVGIVGRTGAGKTSLLTALFRLADIEGQILIDEIDTKSIPLVEFRSKISVIPQEPILFSGTLRKNLDPFEEYGDSDLWNALEQVELKNVVTELPAGLNSTMSEGGSNFSVGQRQLICLARAVIRQNKILVLDEATANVDPQTDELIQKTIRTRFSDCTVLTIAHRLQTVMDSDKILVMSDGCAVEFDHPYVLLQNKKGFLYGLVQQTGATMANHLSGVAETGFNGK